MSIYKVSVHILLNSRLDQAKIEIKQAKIGNGLYT